MKARFHLLGVRRGYNLAKRVLYGFSGTTNLDKVRPEDCAGLITAFANANIGLLNSMPAVPETAIYRRKVTT
jgi:hypothetical protein